jgi:hypothetical protein
MERSCTARYRSPRTSPDPFAGWVEQLPLCPRSILGVPVARCRMTKDEKNDESPNNPRHGQGSEFSERPPALLFMSDDV